MTAVAVSTPAEQADAIVSWISDKSDMPDLSTMDDVRVRDEVIRQLVCDESLWQDAVEKFTSVPANAHTIIAVATLLWLNEQDDEALFIVGVLLEARPDYNLGIMMQQAILAGPKFRDFWRDGMMSLTREECLHE